MYKTMSNGVWYLWALVFTVTFFLGFGHGAWWIATIFAGVELAQANKPRRKYWNRGR
jgi:hypothetical protein